MIFTLVKNELIKVLRRGKTWIVFGLFALAMIGFIFIMKSEADDIAYSLTPEGQIESINEQLEFRKSDLKDNEEYLKEVKNKKSPTKSEIEDAQNMLNYTKEIIRDLEAEKKEQEKLLKEGTIDWRRQVELRIDSSKAELERLELEDSKDKEHINAIKKEIEKNNYFLKNDIKPVESWEFYPSNVGTQIMKIFGVVILASGIAVFMSDIVSGECTPATLKFLLVQPISRGKVILSKFLAIVITVIGMICGLEIVAFGIIGAITGFDAAKVPIELGFKYKINKEVLIQQGYKQLDLIANSGYDSTMGSYVLKSFLLQILFIIACCAFIFMISALFKSSMITMAVSVIISVAATILPMMNKKLGEYAHLIFLNYGNTPEVVQGDVVFTYMNPNFTVQFGIILMIITIIVSYIIAHVVFNRRDMLV